MSIFSRDNVVDADKVQQGQLSVAVEPISAALQEGFIESYLDNCYAWCPVLDRDFFHTHSGLDSSPLLQHALALCGTRINPPLIQYRDSAVYYRLAKELFYNNCEGNALVRLASIMLFFWWSTGAPNQDQHGQCLVVDSNRHTHCARVWLAPGTAAQPRWPALGIRRIAP